MPLDATGFRALRGTDILETMRGDFEARSGLLPDWERDTFLGPLTAAIAMEIGNVAAMTQAIYDQRDPENAEGAALSAIARLAGLTPIDATRSAFGAVVTGTAGTVVGAGQLRVRVDASEWGNIADFAIAPGGSASARFEALVVGPRVATFGAAVGSGLTIETPLLGITDVEVGELDIGRATETDDALYLRWRQSLQVRGSRSVAAIRARILDSFPALTGAIVLENDAPTTETIEGVTIAGPALAVILDPPLELDEEPAFAQFLYGLIPVGVRSVGSVSYVAEGEGLSSKYVRWSYATSISATVALTIRREPATPGQPAPPSFVEIQSLITDAIEVYRTTLGLGDDLLALDVSGIVADVEGVRSITSIVIDADPPDPALIDTDGNFIAGAAQRIGAIVVTVSEA